MFEGENNKLGLIEFMRNPKKSPEKPQDVAWSSTVSDVVHLTAENFDSHIKVIIFDKNNKNKNFSLRS